MTRRREGLAGFYRTYASAQAASLEDAVEQAKKEAGAFGLQRVEVVSEQTGKMRNGAYRVALSGYTEKMIAAEKAAAKKEEKKGLG